MALVKRWEAAKASGNGFNRLANLKDKWNGPGTYASPKDSSGKDICLKFQLEKKCDTGCQRASTHQRYNADVTTRFHGFLDHCQVAASE